MQTRRIKKKSKNNAGFSLVEVIITIFFIGLVLVMYQVTLGKMRFINYAKNKEIALRVANNKIEELRAGGYDNLPSSGSFSDSQLNGLSNCSAYIDISDFNDDTKEIRITVQWNEPIGSAAKNISLSTLITKTGGI